PAANCLALGTGSWTGSFPPPTATANVGTWKGISKSTFAGFIENGDTGATRLQLPFVNSGNKVGAIDIIRRPQATDSQLLTNSRLLTESAIRILLADSITDLHPYASVAGGAGGPGVFDADDVQLGPATQTGAPVGVALTGVPSAGSTMYFATAT